MMKYQHPQKPAAQAMLLEPLAGSAAWWNEIATRGTPWTEPSREGFCRVTFFWRDPQGDETTSETRRVWININGITDHHQSSPPQSLQRLAGTDVWHWQTELRADWRGSYSLIPRTESGAEFPQNNDDYQSMLAAREWWKNLFRHATHDPLNPHRPWPGAKSHALSGLHMPEALPQPAWEEFDLDGPKAPQAPAALQTFRWKSARLGNMRNVWVFTPGESQEPASRPLAILLDGQFWAKQMPVWQPLKQLTRERALPDAVYVLIDVIDIQTRSRELTCNPEFWLAVQDELLPQVRKLAAHSDNAQKTVVAGQSFGGLSSLYAGLHWPERFGCVLSQSGSFWWPHRHRQQASDDQQEAESILSQVEKGLGERSHLKIFMEAGRNEKLIYDVNNQMEALLKPTSNQVHYRVLEGGHDALWWRGGLLDGLCSLWDETQWAAGDLPSDG